MVCAPVRRDNPRALARGLSLRTGAQTMLYLTCTTITSVDLAYYGVSRAKDWVSVDCGTMLINSLATSHVKCMCNMKLTAGDVSLISYLLQS